MKNFPCEICGHEVIEDEEGTLTVFCEHYKPENKLQIKSSYTPNKRNKENNTEKAKEKLKDNTN